MKIFLVVFYFLLLGSLLIISNNNLFLFESGGFEDFSYSFYDWVDSVISNVKGITGQIVESNWVPQ
jgi:hypothetical protein